MIDDIVTVYKEVAQISEVNDARILDVVQDEESGNHSVSVQVEWSSRNLTSKERSFITCDYLVKGENVVSFDPVPANKNVVLRKISRSGKLTAFVVTSEKDKDEQQVMIVGKDGSLRTFDLDAADKHGKVYADVYFSCLEWSADETGLVYVAEKKRPKPTCFITPPKSESEDGRGEEFTFRDEWGEQLHGKHQSVVCFLNLKTEEVTCHALPEQLCPAQVVWAPDSTGVIGVAFVSEPYRLGLVYCSNRKSKLFHMDLKGNFNVISDGCGHIRNPRVSPDGSSVVFLRSEAGGPHAKAAQLCLLSWPTKKERVIVDVVHREMDIEEGHKFKGIFTYSGLPQRCWLNDSQRIVFSSFKCDNIVSYVVNVESGAIMELCNLGSHRVLDVYDNWVLLDMSYICQPSLIMLGYVSEQGQEIKFKPKKVTALRRIPGVSSNFFDQWEFVNNIPHPEPKYSDIPISVIYYGPRHLEQGAAKRPLICWPHGGPHTTLTNIYSMAATFFVKLGYSIVFPNYRGSLGFGEDGVNALPGYCGVVDVSDVYQATMSCLRRFPDVLDESRVFLFGGSHGGFLVTHLAARYPELYKAVSTRNPVTDFQTMAKGTDIRSWIFVESGFPFQYGKVPDATMLTKMHEMSPISYIDSLKAPVLFLVGKNDARVPPSQSISFYKMLLARGVHTELHLYDDCHSLSKVDSEMDCLIHTALWFQKHQNASS